MVEIKERQNFDEMATVCQKADGYGIVIEIYGKIGDKRSPAYAHLLDTSMNEIGEFVLTYDAPKSPSDVIWYRTKNPPEGYASKIVKWSRGFTKFKLNNWMSALQVWDYFHPR